MPCWAKPESSGNRTIPGLHIYNRKYARSARCRLSQVEVAQRSIMHTYESVIRDTSLDEPIVQDNKNSSRSAVYGAVHASISPVPIAEHLFALCRDRAPCGSGSQRGGRAEATQ